MRILCSLNMLTATLAVAIMFVIHQARVCEYSDLYGFLSWINNVMALELRSGAVLAKYSLRDRTQHIEGLVGKIKCSPCL